MYRVVVAPTVPELVHCITLYGMVLFDSIISGVSVQFLALYECCTGLATVQPFSVAHLTTHRSLLLVLVSRRVYQALMATMIKAPAFLLNICTRCKILISVLAQILGDIYAILTTIPVICIVIVW